MIHGHNDALFQYILKWYSVTLSYTSKLLKTKSLGMHDSNGMFSIPYGMKLSV